MAGKKGYFGWLKVNNPDALSEICSKGGKAAQERGTGRRWTPEQAAEAGRKGGSVRGKGNSGKRATSKGN